MQVKFYVSDMIACGYVRGMVPAAEMNRRSDESRLMNDEWAPVPAAERRRVRVDVKSQALYCDLPGTDVMVFQRQHEGRVLEKMHQAQDEGIRCIYDLDDNLWDVSGNHAGPDGTSDDCGDFFARPEVREGMTTFVRDADVVTVSTPELAQIVTHYTGRADGLVVIENALDLAMWKPAFQHRMSGVRCQVSGEGQPFTIGWHASGCHNNDAPLIAEALLELMRARENVHLNLVGWAGLFDEFKALAQFDGRVRIQPWVNLAVLPWVLSQFDVGICCVEDTAFNRCKSAIKWAELSAAGACAVCSPMPAYRRFVENGAVLLPDNSTEAWFTALDDLAADTAGTRARAMVARRAVERTYDVKDRALEWERVFLDARAGCAYKSTKNDERGPGSQLRSVAGRPMNEERGTILEVGNGPEGATMMPPPPDDTGGTPVLDIAELSA